MKDCDKRYEGGYWAFRLKLILGRCTGTLGGRRGSSERALGASFFWPPCQGFLDSCKEQVVWRLGINPHSEDRPLSINGEIQYEPPNL